LRIVDERGLDYGTKVLPIVQAYVEELSFLAFSDQQLLAETLFVQVFSGQMCKKVHNRFIFTHFNDFSAFPRLTQTRLYNKMALSHKMTGLISHNPYLTNALNSQNISHKFIFTT